MKRYCQITFSFLFTLFLFQCGDSWAQSIVNERARWFVDARFGMFIHWGVYSGAEGYWKGEKLRNDNGYAEWIYYRNRIEKEEYLTLLDRFDWDSIDPEAWVILAKKSGMKYVTLTAKHHDGFALWDSKVSDYNVAHYTIPRRDIVKELAEACRKHGLKIGLYYSHWVDWEHPYGWDHTKEVNPITSEQYNHYWQEKVIPQMRELLTNYGPIGIMWFDMWVHHSETIVTKAQLIQLKDLIRELQPNCLVNSRLGLSIEEDRDVDFQTLGDNQLGSYKKDFPWQSPATVAHSWGYNANDTQWKSTTTLLKSLIGNVSLNGNYMLNIGPRSNGDVPYEIEQRLREMGAWLDVNGESIYGSGAFDLNKDQHDWGKITYHPGGNENDKLYLHVYNWPYNKRLPLTGITTRPIKVYALNDPQKSLLAFSHSGAFTEINLSSVDPENHISVIVVEYESKPGIMDGLAAKTTDGGYALRNENIIREEGTISVIPGEKHGTVPPHILINANYKSVWRVYIDKPSEMYIDISYSFQGKDPQGTLAISTNNKTLKHDIVPTGMTVGEPNQNWRIDNFLSHRIGSIQFEEAGYYIIILDVNPKKDSPLKFQWIWLE